MYNAVDLSVRVNHLSTQTSEGILEIGQIFLDAKTHLSPKDYQEFLERTHYVQDSSTIRKWEGIGRSYLRLKCLSQHLPPVLSTIYRLSTLSNDQLNSLIDSQVLTPSVTTKLIDLAIGKSRKTRLNPRLTITFTSSSPDRTIYELQNLLSNYQQHIDLRLNDEAQRIVNTFEVESSVDSLTELELV